MTKSEILEFINEYPVFFLATIEDNNPRVRTMMVCKADNSGIYFNTGKNKDLYKQLSRNHAVEMCFYSAKEAKQIRISGMVEPIDDLNFKKEMVKNFSFLKPWVDKEGYDILAPYCLKKGRAVMWMMEVNFQPKEYVEF